ncbi:hypothetical protein Bhyg_04075, partial [Pseudolycoriella hygida]
MSWQNLSVSAQKIINISRIPDVCFVRNNIIKLAVWQPETTTTPGERNNVKCNRKCAQETPTPTNSTNQMLRQYIT